MAIFVGYIYDIYGRKFTLCIAYMLAGVINCLFPKVAPNTTAFLALNTLYYLIASPLGSAPLINDYVCKSSMGAANSFQGIGVSLGVVVSLAVLVQFTKDLDPKFSWGVIAIIQVGFSFAALFMVSEPPEGLPQEKICKKIKSLSVQTWKVFKLNPHLPIGIILFGLCTGPMVVFEIYLISWLFGFFDPETGPIYDSKEVMRLYQI